MQGRRVYPGPDGRLPGLAEGDFGKDADGLWFVRPPGCHVGTISSHTVVEHEDGTISVTPSILLDEPGVATWHGYLTAGVWITC